MALQWQEGQYSAWYGYAGKMRLFTVNYATARHSDGKMYEVSTDLPQWRTPERFRTTEEAQEYCEIRLDEFIAYIKARTGRDGEDD